MNDSVDCASLLNNEAVLMLASGASGLAFQLFKTALGIMGNNKTTNEQLDFFHTMIASNPLSVNFRNYGPNDSMLYDNIPVAEISLNQPTSSFDSVSIPGIIENCETSFIFSRALSLSPDPASSRHIPLRCAVITFNMALIVHLNEGLTYNCRNHQALQFYDLTLSLLDEASLFQNNSESDCYSLRLVTLNNKAHIHYELLQYHEASKSQDKLLEVIRNIDRVSTAITEYDTARILVNVLNMHPPLYAPAS